MMPATPLLNNDHSPWMRKSNIVSRHGRSANRLPLKSTTSSPAWKDSLKQGCIGRARRKRQEAIWKSRLNSNNSEDTARQLVEDELRESGVTIRAETEDPMTPSLNTELAAADDTSGLDQEDHAISEAELYELMQEVYEELQWNEAREEKVIEEQLLCERLDAQHLEDQIAEFETWEFHRDDSDESVPCPVCKDANLLSNATGIVCPNQMNGSCVLRLEGLEDSIALPSLRERVRTAYEVHAGICSGPLNFSVRTRDNGTSNLFSSCNFCDSNVSII